MDHMAASLELIQIPSHLYVILTFSLILVNNVTGGSQSLTPTQIHVYHMTPNILVTSASTKSSEVRSVLDCVYLCEADTECRSVSYDKATQMCHINDVWLSISQTRLHVEVKATCTYLERHSRVSWKLALRATSDIGMSVYDTWSQSGRHDDWDSVTNASIGCLTIDSRLSCDRHFRSWRLDHWDNVIQMKWALYKNAVEVFYVTFDMEGSQGRDDDLRLTNVIASSASDMPGHPDTGEDIFRGIPGCCRYFTLVKMAHLGCPMDLVWTLIYDTPCPIYCCDYDGRYLTHPKFLYTTTSQAANHYTGELELADVFAVFVKYDGV